MSLLEAIREVDEAVLRCTCRTQPSWVWIAGDMRDVEAFDRRLGANGVIVDLASHEGVTTENGVFIRAPVSHQEAA